MSVYRKRKRHTKALILLSALVICMVLFLELRLKPVTDGIAEIQAQALATEFISRSIDEVFSETGITAEEIEKVTYSTQNTVTSVFTDPVTANRIKNAVTLKLQDKLSGVKNHQVDVPLGTIVGGELLSGTGPSVPIYITLSGNVFSDFESTFEQGGMNQTVHKLSLRVTAEINILMPLDSITTRVETSVLIGEAVIVGEVPDGMLLHSES